MTEIGRFALRLRKDPGYSRNRHFDELSQPTAVRARHLLKRVAGIERELRAGVGVVVRPDGEGSYLLTIEFPEVRARRVSRLSADEHALLSLDESLRPLLGVAAKSVSADPL